MKLFSATIIKLGINPCVNVPEEIVFALLQEAGKKNAPVQVKGTLNDKTQFETNVVKYQFGRLINQSTVRLRIYG